MKKKRYELKPGYEIRGLMIRLYPDKATEELLGLLEKDMRHAWNWLVAGTEHVIRTRQAYAIKNNLVGPKPERPDYNGLEPDEAEAKKKEHKKLCGSWYNEVHNATNKLPECSYHKFKDLLEHFQCKYDYQLLSKVIGWYHEGSPERRKIVPNAHMLQSLFKNYMQKAEGQRRKKFRKSSDPMPLQVRSGESFELGDFGERRGKSFYNCQVRMNGLTIRGRLPGRLPEGRVLEGVSIRKEPDGWWASIKQEVPIRVPPVAEPGTVIGIDVGLDNIVAMSHPKDTAPIAGVKKRIKNERGKKYIEQIAGRQAAKKPVGRLQQAAARHNLHLIYNEIVKPLARVETIKVEKLVSTIGQMGSSKVSSMKTVIALLRQRYGERVREVLPHYTSQDCSQCGHRSKESWSYEHGRYGKCPVCGYKEDRDVNAARNIASRPMIPLAA